MPREVQTSIGLGAGGDQHNFHLFGVVNGINPHPLQRAGAVSMASIALAPAIGAAFIPGLGDPNYPAARFTMSLPPVVNANMPGGSNDPDFMV